ncbi:MAG: reverse transcriptase domain-containing protein [Opitutaceae bacterium]
MGLAIPVFPRIYAKPNIRVSEVSQWTLSPIQVFRKTRETRELARPACRYEPADKAILQNLLPKLGSVLERFIPKSCVHLKGRGGYREAVRQIDAAIKSGGSHGNYRYVCRSDARSYYDSIDCDILYKQLLARIDCRSTLDRCYQYLHRCICRDGIYRRVDKGLPHGGSLSPLLAALYLAPLDHAMGKLRKKGVFYVRFMDDWVILAPNRYKLREAVRIMNEVLTGLKLEQHPDKTFIGRLSHGFEAFGYQFSQEDGRVDPSKISVQRFATRLVERYAQHESRESLLHYVNRWLSTQISAGLSPAVGQTTPSSLKRNTKQNQRKQNYEKSNPIHAAMETYRYRSHGPA